MKHTSWLPQTQHNRPSHTAILKQYFELNCTVSMSDSHPGTKHQLHLSFLLSHKIILSQNTVRWLLVIDMNVSQPHKFRLLQNHQNSTIRTLKSLFGPEVRAALTSDGRQVVFMARGPGLTPSGIPAGREPEPVMQMWRPLNWQFKPVYGLDLPAPALRIMIGWLWFPISQFHTQDLWN